MLVDNVGSCISVELLDSEQVHAMQVWTFEANEVVTIGRSVSQDVTIPNPHVSRLHAEFRWEIDGWSVKSHGRNGVLLNGEKVDAGQLSHGCIVRLGATGPVLRFILGRPQQASGATMCEQSSELNEFQIDESRKQREVEAVAGDDFFQQLKERADVLRRKRKA
mgnify:CR=1 FL=1